MGKLTPLVVLLALGIASPAISDQVFVDTQYGYSEEGIQRRVTRAQIFDDENKDSRMGDMTFSLMSVQGEETPRALVQYDWSRWGINAYGERPQEGKGLADVRLWVGVTPGIKGVVEGGFDANANGVYRIAGLSAREIDLGFMGFSADAFFSKPVEEEIDAHDHGYGWAAFHDEIGYLSTGRNPEDNFLHGSVNLGAIAARGFSRFDHEDPDDFYTKWILAIDPNESSFDTSTMNSRNGETITNDTFIPKYHPLNWNGAGQVTYINASNENGETHSVEFAARMNDSLALGMGFVEGDGEYDLIGSVAVNHEFGKATLAGEATWNGETLETQLGVTVPYYR